MRAFDNPELLDKFFPYFRTRHLLMHIFPCETYDKGASWRWNCEQIRRRIGLFNGKRVVSVATDKTTAKAEIVEEVLSGLNIEFHRVENDPSLREVASFDKLFGSVSDHTSPDDVSFFCHAKGTTNFSWGDGGKVIRHWADVMYETNLDHWARVAEVLQEYPVAGSLKRSGKYWPESSCEWHYSGSYFWVRNKDLFTRNWQNVDRFWCGAETYVGVMFAAEEGGVVFGDLSSVPGEASWPYRREVWDNYLEPALREWRVGKQVTIKLASNTSKQIRPRQVRRPAGHPITLRAGQRLVPARQGGCGACGKKRKQV